MTRNVSLKDSVYERLSIEKGDRSFSWIIEQYMKGTPANLPAKTDLQAVSP